MRADRLFRRLLFCLPGPFRKEYGGEMERAFLDELSEARCSGSRTREAGLWLRSLRDLSLIAPKEHIHQMRHDLRYAFRTLASQPGFTTVAVLSLALGIGANLAIFSLADAVLWRSLPVTEPESLVLLTNPNSQGNSTGMQTGERSLLTYEEFLQIRDQAPVFRQFMAVQSGLDRIQARVNGSEPEDIRSRMVSAEYFSTLGVAPLAGRALTPEDGPKPTVAVLSHEFWQRRYGGRLDAIGTPITMRGGTFTVAGVMPEGFFGETVGDRPDVWLPLAQQPVVMPGRDLLHDNSGDLQKSMWLHAFARLKPGTTMEQAQAAVNVVFQQNLAAYYATAPTEEARRRFLNQQIRLRSAATGASGIRETFGEPLTLLMAAAGMVLLIACANLGNLMLARTTARASEMSVRLALGASRGNLLRQLQTESLLLAAAGGVTGALAAVGLRAGLLTLAGPTIAIATAPGLTTILFGVALTAVAGVLLGVLPALWALGLNANAGLKAQGRGLTSSAGWLRAGKLVVGLQVALSLPLLVGTGLLVRTLDNLRHVELGFPKENLLMVRANVERAGYAESQRQAVVDRLFARVKSVPGVRMASYSSYGVMTGGDTGDEVQVEGYVRTGQDDSGSAYDHVGPGYFSALGVPLLLGREVNESDHASAPKVCVINEAFAKKFFAGRNPIGRNVTQVYGNQRNTFAVIGVVKDFRKRGLRGQIEHRYYVPFTRPVDPQHSVTFAIRASGEPANVLAATRRAIHAEDAGIPVITSRTVEELVDDRTAQDSMLARLSVAFGIVALLLSAVGLYGVLSYGVARRTNEIGIRKALGAREGTVVQMILGETGWLVAGGLAAGLTMAMAGMKWMESRLVGLTTKDPLTLAAAVAVLGLVALVAAWLPARRASRVDPLVAIRYE